MIFFHGLMVVSKILVIRILILQFDRDDSVCICISVYNRCFLLTKFTC